MIVVFGSVNVDLVFAVAALPGEGETVISDSVAVVAGGKGANQAVAAARAGAAVRLAACVGSDAFAEIALASLAAAGVDVGALRRVAAPTGCAAVVVDAQGRNQITVAAGANRQARASQVADADLGPATILVLQMEVPADENWALIERARALGARIVLNAAPALAVPADAFAALDTLIVNEGEAMTLAAAAGLPGADAVAAARALADRFAIACVVTLGGRGAHAFLEGGEWAVGALPLTPIDTTAAGDAFVGAYAAALDAGLAASQALHRASVAGGLACLKAGAQPSLPTRDEIEARLSELAPARRL